MNKHILLLVLVGILSIGLVHAFPFEYNSTNLTSTNTGWLQSTYTTNWISYVPELDMVYSVVAPNTSYFFITAYNESSNTWTNLTGSAGRSTALDATKDWIVSGYSSGVLLIYNISNNSYYTTNLGGFTQQINGIDIKDNVVYVGANSGRFAKYNISNNTWTDLSTTDPGNWANVSTFLTVLVVDNLVYTGGFNPGKLGVYNMTDGVWYDITNLSVSNWIASVGIGTFMAYDNVSDTIYMNAMSNNGNNFAGIYNRSANKIYRLYDGVHAIQTLNQGVDIDPINRLLYISGTGQLYVYDMDSGIWTMNISSLTYARPGGRIAFDTVHNRLFVIPTSGGANLFVVDSSTPCIETWVKNTNVCDSANTQKIITYTDTHSCGTNASLPIDNGTFEYCCEQRWNFNNTACSSGTYTRQYYDIYSCGNMTGFPADNGTVLSCTDKTGFPFFADESNNVTAIRAGVYHPITNQLYIGRVASTTPGYTSPFYVYNISTQSWTDLSTTDAGDWFGSNRLTAIDYDPFNQLIYTGSSVTGGKFGYYNYSNNVWTDLSATDTTPSANWAGTRNINELAVHNVTGLVYTAHASGAQYVLGVYNKSSNVWTGKQPSGYSGSGEIVSLAIDSQRDIIYLGTTGSPYPVFIYNITSNAGTYIDLGLALTSAGAIGYGRTQVAFDATHNLVYVATQYGRFAVYNPVTNKTIDLTNTGPIPKYISTLFELYYDPINDLVYLSGTGYAGVYNPVTNILTTIDSEHNSIYSSTSFQSFISGGNNIYFTTSGGVALSKLYNLSCVEHWIPSDTTCTNGLYTIGYIDNNSCGTNNYMPTNTGVVQRCGNNYVADTWYEKKYTARSPEENWIDTSAPVPFEKFGNDIIFSTPLMYKPGEDFFYGRLIKYNPTTDVQTLYPTATVTPSGFGNMLDGDTLYVFPDTSYNYLYANLSNFGKYNFTSNTFTDLSMTDIGGWTNGAAVIGRYRVNDKLYTGLRLQTPNIINKFGVYNITDNTWYELPQIIHNMIDNGYSTQNNAPMEVYGDILYIGMYTYPQGNLPNKVALYAWNTTADTYEIIPIYTTSTNQNFNIGQLLLVDDTLYISFTGVSPLPLAWGVYNITSQTFTNLSNADVGDWMGTQGIANLRYDAAHDIIYLRTYLSGTVGGFGVYNISNGVLYNHSLAGNTSVGDELLDSYAYGAMYLDTTEEKIYLADQDGFHIYTTTFFTCTENCTPPPQPLSIIYASTPLNNSYQHSTNITINLTVTGENYTTIRVYNSTGLYSAVNATSYTFTTLPNGMYYYNATAYNDTSSVSTPTYNVYINEALMTGDNFTIILNTTALSTPFNETTMSITPDGKTVLVIGQTNLIYWSNDYGQTWKNVSNPVTTTARPFIAADNSYWLLVSGYISMPGIYRSTDNGTSWTQVETVGTYNAVTCNIHGICLAAKSGTAPIGVRRSNDYGVTWTQVLDIGSPGSALSLYISNTNESIFGTAYSGGTPGTIYYSNNTINYTKTILPCVNNITFPTPGCYDGWRNPVCNPDMSECYIIVNDNSNLVGTGIYKSTTKGYNWTLTQNITNYGVDVRSQAASNDFGVQVISTSNKTLISHYGTNVFGNNNGTRWRGSAVSANGSYAYIATSTGEVYRSNSAPIPCTENWVQDPWTCYAVPSYIITYHDTNMCNTTVNLPVNNGTVVNCSVLYPNMTKFDGATSNVSNLTFAQITNYTGLILENSTAGKIEWNNPVNLYDQNFNAYIFISQNYINVISGNLHSSLNSPANISLYNLYFTNPSILRDGQVCNTCSIINNSGGTIKFSVPGFSNYTITSIEYRNYTTIGYVTYANFTFDFYQEPNTTTTQIQCFDNTNNWITIGTVTGN